MNDQEQMMSLITNVRRLKAEAEAKQREVTEALRVFQEKEEAWRYGNRAVQTALEELQAAALKQAAE